MGQTDKRNSPHPLLHAEGIPGTCRVVCFSPRHDQTLAVMDIDDIHTVVNAWAEQVSELGAPGGAARQKQVDFLPIVYCHKWMMAPKGSAFLYARPDVQDLVEPLVVSWGWKPEQSFSTGSPFIDVLQWLGTHDPSAALAVPAAIRFMKEHGWPDVSQGCHATIESAVARCVELTGLEPLSPSGAGYFHQMGSVSLPPIPDLPAFKEKLFEKYRIEVPCFDWNGRPLLRISMQAYNTPDDVDCHLDALGEMLASMQTWKRSPRAYFSTPAQQMH